MASNLLPPAQLAAIREREAKATEGPWMGAYWPIPKPNWWIACLPPSNGPGGSSRLGPTICGMIHEEPNGTFIAHARTDIPALLRHADAQAARIEELTREVELWKLNYQRQIKATLTVRTPTPEAP